MKNEKSTIINRTPKLRFPGFTGEWVVKKLGKVCDIVMGQSPSSDKYNTIGDGLPLIQGNSDIKDRKSIIRLYTSQITKICQANDILMSVRAPVGYISRATTKSCIGRGVCAIKNGTDYIYQYLLSIEPSWEKLAAGSTFTCVNSDDIEKHSILLPPSLAEQQKIASCLSSLDELIAANQQQADSLKAHKKGLMQQLFPQAGNCTPNLRFPGFEGDWEVKKLGEIFNRITRKNAEDNKNVLTISAQYGLVSQTDFFNKSVAAADVTGYYLLEKGDFAYNKSSSSGNPVGVIKPLKRCEKGVVSTLYICFNCKEPKSIPFWEQYFNAGCLDSEIRTIAQEGARNHGLLNVPTSDFFTLNVLAPTLAEQQKIADCLSALDEEIAAQEQKVEALKEHKKGLMQQLFPQPTK